MPREMPLGGGRVTKGVMRVGETVRRPRTTNSDLIRRLLDHLASWGFTGVPASLGADEQGREAFAFIPGEVPAELAFHGDDVLREAAGLIRRYHDLGAELLATGEGVGACGEVVCHNDLSPCNFVFREGLPRAIIDFDAAAPGSRIRDLGYAAWLWLDIGSPETSGVEQARRLSVFLDAYGTVDREHVVAAMLERQGALVAEGKRIQDTAMARWAADCRAWTLSNASSLNGSRGVL